MRIATYNIQSANYGRSMDEINKEITDLKIDIIGFQEIDNLTRRSGGVNVLNEICKNDYKYYEYSASMEFDGGYYGIGIASVYPIQLIKTVHYETADLEPRILMICKVNIDNKIVYIANTHLSYENIEIRNKQFRLLANELKKYTPIILFGDFNVSSFNEFDVIDLSKVNSSETPIESFKEEIPFRCIDNIFYSNEIKLIKTELNKSESSDHNMIWADINIT